MADKVCLLCGKTFFTWDSRVVYCCPGHRLIGNKKHGLYVKLQKAQRLAIQAKAKESGHGV